jgi:hypothetical protein
VTGADDIAAVTKTRLTVEQAVACIVMATKPVSVDALLLMCDDDDDDGGDDDDDDDLW